MSATDPARAAAVARGIGSERERIAALEPVIRAWVQRDPAGARRWIMAEPDDALRDWLVGSGATTLAASDPCTAMEWAVGAIRSDPLMEDVALAIVGSWTDRRPAEAAALVDQLPAGALREQAADRVAQRWAAANPTTAYIWMKGSAESERLLAQLAGQP